MRWCTVLVLLAAVASTTAFVAPPPLAKTTTAAARQRRWTARRSTPLAAAAPAAQQAFDDALAQEQVDAAIGMLTNWHAELAVTPTQAEQLLNAVPFLSVQNAARLASVNMSEAAPDADLEDERFQQMTAKLYSKLQQRGLLRGFGSVTGGPLGLARGEDLSWPCSGSLITPEGLTTLTGLEQAALTPGQQNQLWGFAGMVVFGLELAVSSALGVRNPLDTVVPLTLGVFAIDRFLLRGAPSETVLRALLPQYRAKVIRHEAAHLCVAYLLGCPIESCVLNAWDAMKQPRFFAASAAAGTVFFDPVLSAQMRSGTLVRSTLDRYSCIVMAGIAAEALFYGKAEGGASDESALINFFTSIQPPWDIDRIRDQGRWGVTQAVLLLREHKDGFEALVEALSAGLPLGACIAAFEKHLPAELPADGRRRELSAQRDGLESLVS